MVSSLYNLVNVPSAIWIDEEGRIRRINEGTYSKEHVIGGFQIGTNEYRRAVLDWIVNGENSIYIWSETQSKEKIQRQTSEESLAGVKFRLGVYFFERGNELLARTYWEEAQQLYPDNWNFHRQDWSFIGDGSGGDKFRDKAAETDLYGGTKPYYEPLDLPEIQDETKKN